MVPYKEILLEASIHTLEEVLEKKYDEFSMILRASEKATIYPGESILLPTGIEMSIPEIYEESIELLRIFQTRSWLRISPYLIKRGKVSCVDLMNLSQDTLARMNQLQKGAGTLDRHKGIYVQTLEDLKAQPEGTRLHVAHKFERGDEIAKMTIRRKYK